MYQKNHLIVIFIFILVSTAAQTTLAESKTNEIQDLTAKLVSLTEAMNQQISHISRNSEVNVVIGDTGVGKSTLINYLIGTQMTVKQNIFGEYFIETSEKVGLEIGHDFKSKTKAPEIAVDKDGNIFIDTAGFEDTEGFKADIINGLLLKRILNEFSMKKIILVVDQKSLSVNRGQNFRQNLLRIRNVFGSNFDNLMIVISKARSDINYRELLLKVVKDDDSANARFYEDYFKDVIEKAPIIGFKQVGKEQYEQNIGEPWNYKHRKDRLEILNELELLPASGSNKIRMTYDGNNALKISYLKEGIENTVENKLKGFQTQISNQLERYDSITLTKLQEKNKICAQHTDTVSYDLVVCEKDYPLDQFKMELTCLAESSGIINAQLQQKYTKQVKVLIESIDSFSALFDDIFIGQKEQNRQEKVDLNIYKEIEQFKQQLIKLIKEKIELKKKEQFFREQQQEFKRRQEERAKYQRERRNYQYSYGSGNKKQSAGGATLGAATGATAGAVVGGPVGAMIGALVGGLLGRLF